LVLIGEFEMNGLYLIFAIAGVLGAIGWVANIVQIVGMINDPITGMLIFKCLGAVVAPIGSILGIIGMF
jgi:hypothetical protein